MDTIVGFDHGRSASSFTILVVEDYEPFRRFVCSTLKNRPEFEVVGEVSDGLEAVQKAEKLQPDLILMDVGLPTLNGIDAARRIRNISPKSKIVFLSQECSPDIVQEAFLVGAMGYVAKVHAGVELLAAMASVCEGTTFVGNGAQVSGRDSADLTFDAEP